MFLPALCSRFFFFFSFLVTLKSVPPPPTCIDIKHKMFGWLDSLAPPPLGPQGFTGHPMGVSFEDVAAVEALHRGVIPPTANNATVDPSLVRATRWYGMV